MLSTLRFRPGRYNTFINRRNINLDNYWSEDKYEQFRLALGVLGYGFYFDSNCPSETCGAWPSKGVKLTKLKISGGNIDILLEENSEKPMWFISTVGQYSRIKYSIRTQQFKIGRNGKTLADPVWDSQKVVT